MNGRYRFLAPAPERNRDLQGPQLQDLHPSELQHLIPNYDVPDKIRDGWRMPSAYYSAEGMSRTHPGDYIVTRPEGYVPYQSVVQPDGRYAYNPDHRQYPRKQGQELRPGRNALHPASRQIEFIVNRGNHYPHQPGEEVRMGINYDQMRTATIPQPQQPMVDQYGRPMVQGYGYGGSYGGQR